VAEVISYFLERETLCHKMTGTGVPERMGTAMQALDLQRTEATADQVVQGTLCEGAKWRLQR
jgi:hypothetical protein